MIAYTFFNRPAAEALYLALIADDPFYITLETAMETDPAEAKEGMLRYMDYAMTEAKNHGRLVLTPDQASGAAVWAGPMDEETAQELSRQKKTFIRTHLGEKSLAAYTSIVSFMAAQTQGLIPANTWYLSILGVSPHAQGNGLGTELLRPVLGTADLDKAPAYIESFTPRNFLFYQRLGFQTAKTVFEPVTGSEYAVMIRQPDQQPDRA